MTRSNARPGRWSGGVALLVVAIATIAAAPVNQRATGRATVTRSVTNAACASDLGIGVRTKRRFCDVVIASTSRESVSVAIPPHAGSAGLMFDLHNRFTVPPAGADPVQSFARHTAIIAIVTPTGEVIERAAVSREYRTIADVFDRIGGTGRGSAPKIVAPGHGQAIRVEIPAGVTTVGIVGTRLEEWRATGRGAFDNPNKPIAMVSNLRIEYVPR
jgi:hypothetical protein